MTIGELKKSLTRFGSDMDDVEIIFNYNVADKDYFESLGFVAYSEIPGEEATTVCILGTMSAAIARMKKGTLKDINGKSITDIGIDLSDNG